MNVLLLNVRKFPRLSPMSIKDAKAFRQMSNCLTTVGEKCKETQYWRKGMLALGVCFSHYSTLGEMVNFLKMSTTPIRLF